jgi:hypothetical protein
MKKEEFEKLKKDNEFVIRGTIIEILYRSNWRGGDGKPFNHRNGKKIGGVFEYFTTKGIKIRNSEYPINYKAIKQVGGFTQPSAVSTERMELSYQAH